MVKRTKTTERRGIMRCYRGGNKHKFEPRYTEEPSTVDSFEGKTTTSELRKLMVLQKYVCDVCVWCGKTARVEEKG